MLEHDDGGGSVACHTPPIGRACDPDKLIQLTVKSRICCLLQKVKCGPGMFGGFCTPKAYTIPPENLILCRWLTSEKRPSKAEKTPRTGMEWNSRVDVKQLRKCKIVQPSSHLSATADMISTVLHKTKPSRECSLDFQN